MEDAMLEFLTANPVGWFIIGACTALVFLFVCCLTPPSEEDGLDDWKDDGWL